METIGFLRDIEDETKYAQCLEIAYVDAFNAIQELKAHTWEDSCRPHHPVFAPADDARIKELKHITWVMSGVIRDCSDRRKRLADVAARLPDVVFDEERPEV